MVYEHGQEGRFLPGRFLEGRRLDRTENEPYIRVYQAAGTDHIFVTNEKNIILNWTPNLILNWAGRPEMVDHVALVDRDKYYLSKGKNIGTELINPGAMVTAALLPNAPPEAKALIKIRPSYQEIGLIRVCIIPEADYRRILRELPQEWENYQRNILPRQQRALDEIKKLSEEILQLGPEPTLEGKLLDLFR
jgi:hypothetical protein